MNEEILKDPFIQCHTAILRGDFATADKLISEGLDVRNPAETVALLLGVLTGDGLSYSHDNFDRAAQVAKRYSLSYDHLKSWYEARFAWYKEKNVNIEAEAPGLALCGEFLAYQKTKVA
ncbi:MAG: hypothetical protein QG632_255 [Candidatus Dependentiae bacterium]|nr:hypothetical protein [Candidatus Dependentiae bacterium]